MAAKFGIGSNRVTGPEVCRVLQLSSPHTSVGDSTLKMACLLDPQPSPAVH